MNPLLALWAMTSVNRIASTMQDNAETARYEVMVKNNEYELKRLQFLKEIEDFKLKERKVLEEKEANWDFTESVMNLFQCVLDECREAGFNPMKTQKTKDAVKAASWRLKIVERLDEMARE